METTVPEDKKWPRVIIIKIINTTTTETTTVTTTDTTTDTITDTSNDTDTTTNNNNNNNNNVTAMYRESIVLTNCTITVG